MKDAKVIPLQRKLTGERFALKAFDALNLSAQLCNALNQGQPADHPNVKNITVALTDKLAALPMKEFYEMRAKT